MAGRDLRVTVRSEAALGTARNRGLDVEFLRAQLGRLGNTAYELAELEAHIEGSPFAPSSLLNQVRREAVEQLQARQGKCGRGASIRLRFGRLRFGSPS